MDIADRFGLKQVVDNKVVVVVDTLILLRAENVLQR